MLNAKKCSNLAEREGFEPLWKTHGENGFTLAKNQRTAEIYPNLYPVALANLGRA